ncbi:MAG TPA: HD domain-containing protein [Anaerolineales bacterium]|nr:HD domain-containing protein [Anaerolineales bacterium]
MRLGYRLLQFWQALWSAPTQADLEEAGALLPPNMMELFLRMQTSEQAHSLRVFHELLEIGQTQPELLAAALLHDVGKSIYPLRLWERVWIVIGKALFPKKVKSWGQGAPRGWRRAFVVAEKHPTWGAELAAQAGAAPLTTELIRRHQEAPLAHPAAINEALLETLQRFDDRA